MGEIVNRAAKLAAMGNKDYNPPIYISDNFHFNLYDQDRKDLCTPVWGTSHYTANMINQAMQNWYTDNCN